MVTYSFDQSVENAIFLKVMRIRPMFFSETSDGKTLNGKSYPHPPLVFVVDGESCFDVKKPMAVFHRTCRANAGSTSPIG